MIEFRYAFCSAKLLRGGGTLRRAELSSAGHFLSKKTMLHQWKMVINGD